MTADKTAVPPPRTVILGIGNILLGDEGVGVRVVEALERAGGLPGAELVDGGTAGLGLLGFFDGAGLVVVVDAAADGAPPGTVNVSEPAFAAGRPPAGTSHEIGLKGILDALALADKRPEIVLVTVSVTEAERASLELSPEVARAVPEAAARIRDLLRGRRGTPTSR